MKIKIIQIDFFSFPGDSPKLDSHLNTEWILNQIWNSPILDMTFSLSPTEFLRRSFHRVKFCMIKHLWKIYELNKQEMMIAVTIFRQVVLVPRNNIF